MMLVRIPTLIVDRHAVRARLDIALHEHADETVIDSLLDIPALLAEIENLLRHESQHRYEFADLLAAARCFLSAAHRDHSAALSGLSGVWTCTATSRPTNSTSGAAGPTPTERRR